MKVRHWESNSDVLGSSTLWPLWANIFCSGPSFLQSLSPTTWAPNHVLTRWKFKAWKLRSINRRWQADEARVCQRLGQIFPCDWRQPRGWSIYFPSFSITDNWSHLAQSWISILETPSIKPPKVASPLSYSTNGHVNSCCLVRTRTGSLPPHLEFFRIVPYNTCTMLLPRLRRPIWWNIRRMDVVRTLFTWLQSSAQSGWSN